MIIFGDLIYKTFMMIAAVIIIGLLAALVFGYDDWDDDDK